MTAVSERLDAIEARKNAATPGPWFREYGDVITAHPDPRDVEEGYDDPRNARVVRIAPHLAQKEPQAIYDAEFIAQAPSDVAYLLDLTRKQQAAMEAVKEIHVPNAGHNPDCDCGIALGDGARCCVCYADWPCPTIKALEVKP